MRWALGVLIGLVVLAGCEGMGVGSLELIAAIEGPLQELVKRGGLSEEQASHVMEIVRGVIAPALSGGGFDWMRLLEIVASIGGSLVGVRLWRGGIRSRRGTAPGVAR